MPTLTIENARNMAEKLRLTLEGEIYTFIEVLDGVRLQSPKIRPNEVLEDIKFEDGDKLATIIFSSGGEQYIYNTTAHDGQANDSSWNPYWVAINFDKENIVTITHLDKEDCPGQVFYRILAIHKT